MIFSSLLFLYAFLPCCVGSYFLCRSIRAKNAVLIGFSLLFYAWGEPVYVLALIGSAAVNYLIGRLIFDSVGRNGRRALLALGCMFNLGYLVFFKYAGFLTGSVNEVFGWALPVPAVHMPIGISFYTFQALSYLIDVFRRRCEGQRSFFRFLLYLTLFPQLIAGPIVRYGEIDRQLSERSTSWGDVQYGLNRFCVGLGKKVLLANYAAKAVAQLLDGPMADTTTAGAWLGVILFTVQIYFDFSGYSDMAIGLGRIFGFKYAENFNLPYTASSITEFWRRWHISLSTFFRDYLYIPMGGRRKRPYFNLLVVWLLTGLWHGASWNFVLWGLYYFVLLSLERLLSKFLHRVPIVLRHVLTLFFVAVGWAVFYCTDFVRMGTLLSSMFGLSAVPLYSSATVGLFMNQLIFLLLATLFASKWPQMASLSLSALSLRGVRGRRLDALYMVCVLAVDLALLVLSTASLVGGSYNPFLYFRF